MLRFLLGATRLELVVGLDAHRPREFVEQRLCVHLLDGHVVALAPGDGDARVEVVDFRRAERNRLELLLHVHLRRHFGYALLQRQRLFERLFGPLFAAGFELLLERVLLVLELLHLVAVRLGHRLLVIAEHRHLLVRLVVRRLFLQHREARVGVLEEAGERDGGVVGAENLDGEAGHELLQVLVHGGRVDEVENHLPAFLPFDEALDRGEGAFVHLVRLLVADGVFAEKVKVDRLGLLELDVLDAERADADGVGEVLVLLAAGAQRELVDEVGGDGELRRRVVRVFELGEVVDADLLDVLLELARLGVLGHVRLRLDGGVGGELHVLPILGVDAVAPAGEPRHVLVHHHLFPLAARGRRRDGILRADVDGDVLRHDALLHHPHLRVVPAPAEEPRWLDAKVANLLLAPVDVRVQKLLLRLRLGLLRLQLLLLRLRLLLLAQPQKVLVHNGEIRLGEILEQLFVLRREHLAKSLPKVAVELGLLAVVRVQHRGVKRRNLLLLRAQSHRLAVVQKLHAVRHVRVRKQNPLVLQRRPVNLLVSLVHDETVLALVPALVRPLIFSLG
mmetsp:Transcript_1997/g.7327  ORF Transcript_1997/g.7327 Transcript_1997/m.7327 type:complete len:563 (+) Transcript_1997:1593-3281(+)